MAKIGIRPLANMCRQIGVSLRAGLDIRKVWEHEANHGSAAFRYRAQEVHEQIAGGESLASAMRSVSPFYPDLTCDLVDVGEQSGRLEDVFLKLANHYDHMFKLRRQFLIAIAWPILQLIMSIFIIGGMIALIWMLVPPSKEEPIKILIFTCNRDGLLHYVLIVGITMGYIALGIFALVKGWLGGLPMIIITYVPVLGKCIKTMALARFSWSFSMALNAGVDARQSMRLALRSTHNRYFTSHGERIDQMIVEGKSFHESLSACGAFPVDFLNALETAEISGTQTESLERLATYYQDRAETASKILTHLASFMIWIMVGVLIITLIIQLFLTLYLKPINDALDMV